MHLSAETDFHFVHNYYSLHFYTFTGETQYTLGMSKVLCEDRDL